MNLPTMTPREQCILHSEKHRREAFKQQQFRTKAERVDAAFSEYLMFMSVVFAIAEDTTVEALKYFVPDAKEKKAIQALPKAQRKKYMKEHWPYYRQELKQYFDSIDPLFFETMAPKTAVHIDMQHLQGMMDESLEKMRHHIYILRQGVKRWLGRIKDKNGKHLENCEQLSYLYVADMMWHRVCVCHDMRMKQGATPIGSDLTEEVKEYMKQWTAENHRRTSEGLPSLPSRYYDSFLETHMHQLRPTKIHNAMNALVKQLIGCWHNEHDPKNADIVKSDNIIIRCCMSTRFVMRTASETIAEDSRYKEQYKLLDQYTDETSKHVTATIPMLTAISIRTSGKCATEHILEWTMRKNPHFGYQRYNELRDVLTWLDTKLPPAEDKELERDLKKFDEMAHVFAEATDAEDFAKRLEEVTQGDERLTQTFIDTMQECNDLPIVQKRLMEMERAANLRHYEEWRKKNPDKSRVKPYTPPTPPTPEPTPAEVQLEPQPAERKIRRERWKPEDAQWLMDAITHQQLSYEQCALHLGRTEVSCRLKVSRMNKAEREQRMKKKPLRLTKEQ